MNHRRAITGEGFSRMSSQNVSSIRRISAFVCEGKVLDASGKLVVAWYITVNGNWYREHGRIKWFFSHASACAQVRRLKERIKKGKPV